MRARGRPSRARRPAICRPGRARSATGRPTVWLGARGARSRPATRPATRSRRSSTGCRVPRAPGAARDAASARDAWCGPCWAHPRRDGGLLPRAGAGCCEDESNTRAFRPHPCARGAAAGAAYRAPGGGVQVAEDGRAAAGGDRAARRARGQPSWRGTAASRTRPPAGASAGTRANDRGAAGRGGGGTYVPQAGEPGEEILELDRARRARRAPHRRPGGGARRGRRAGDGQAAARAAARPRASSVHARARPGGAHAGRDPRQRGGSPAPRGRARRARSPATTRGARCCWWGCSRGRSSSSATSCATSTSRWRSTSWRCPYGSATDSSGVVRILKDLDAAIEGRDVLIVEDIVDSGLTLQYLLRNLGSRNPRPLEVCALLTKPARRKVDLPTATWASDRGPLRSRLRARPRRAVPQPALRGGARVVLRSS